MDPHTSATKRGHSDVESTQNPDPNNMASSSKEAGDGIEVKRSKQQESSPDPLAIAHILEKILSFLDTRSIKSARQVNKFWSIEGAKMLFTKCYVRIPWALRNEKDPIKENEMKEKFKAFLSKKSNQAVMVPNISVHDARDVELLKPFGVLGKQVTSLKMDLSQAKEPAWLTSFLNLLPNLKHLALEDYEFEEYEDDELVYNKERIILMKVLTSVLSKAKKDRDPLSISSMILPAQKKVDLKALEKFSDCSKIKIETLKIVVSPVVLKGAPENETRILNTVGKLLSGSQNILKSVSLPCCETYLSLLDFPLMAKLTDLKLKFFSKSSPLRRCDFLPSFRFSEKLPNLKNVAIELKTMHSQPNDDFFKNLFENTGTSPTVKKLKYSTLYMDSSIAPLLQAFPNVEELEVSGSRCCKNMLYSIWEHGENLKKLNIVLHLNGFYGNLADLDSIFTGFAPEVLLWINKAPKGLIYGFENVETSRVNPSILKLKGLKHLRISIVGGGGIGTRYLPKRMLAVSGKWAFRRMPKKTKVVISVKDCCNGLEHAMEVLAEVSNIPNVEIDLDGEGCCC